VTASLRSIDIRTGQVLNTVSVTKTIYSYQFSANVYRYVNYQSLLQAETGYTTNEPQQLAVKEALESAVVHLTVAGVHDRYLELRNEQDWSNPVIQATLRANQANMSGDETDDGETIPMLAMTADYQPQMVVPLVSNTEMPAAKVIADAPVKPALIPLASPVVVPAPVAPLPVAAVSVANVPAVAIKPNAAKPLKAVKADKPAIKAPVDPAAGVKSFLADRVTLQAASSVQAMPPTAAEKVIAAPAKALPIHDIKAVHATNSSASDDIFNSYWGHK